MNSPTIKITRVEAQALLDQYVSAASQRGDRVTATDAAIVRALRVAADGGRLIDVSKALARADRRSCRWFPEVNWDQGKLFRTGGGWFYYGSKTSPSIWDAEGLTIRSAFHVPKGTFGVVEAARQSDGYRAMTPLIPLPHRPTSKLSNFYLLWEANWHPEPPSDPYLLRPLTGALMEIVAEWDVSPLELAAVRQSLMS